jgi:small subunit ribosomal protein S19
MSRTKWKGPYVDYKNLSSKNQQKKILHRNSEIVPQFVGLTVQVYNGKNYIDVTITDDMINHKIGEFVFTRGKFSFKKKK